LDRHPVLAALRICIEYRTKSRPLLLGHIGQRHQEDGSTESIAQHKLRQRQHRVRYSVRSGEVPRASQWTAFQLRPSGHNYGIIANAHTEYRDMHSSVRGVAGHVDRAKIKPVTEAAALASVVSTSTSPRRPAVIACRTEVKRWQLVLGSPLTMASVGYRCAER
jgi:hypothetical protein